MDEVEDLYDDEGMFEEIKNEGNIILDQNLGDDGDKEKTGKKKPKTKSQQYLKKLEEENFSKEYQKAGGIQHIICSATLTIDKQGRITPRSAKKEKKKQMRAKSQPPSKKNKGGEGDVELNTIEELCRVLKFRSKNPKIIDLTEEERMPETL